MTPWTILKINHNIYLNFLLCNLVRSLLVSLLGLICLYSRESVVFKSWNHRTQRLKVFQSSVRLEGKMIQGLKVPGLLEGGWSLTLGWWWRIAYLNCCPSAWGHVYKQEEEVFTPVETDAEHAIVPKGCHKQVNILLSVSHGCQRPGGQRYLTHPANREVGPGLIHSWEFGTETCICPC